MVFLLRRLAFWQVRRDQACWVGLRCLLVIRNPFLGCLRGTGSILGSKSDAVDPIDTSFSLPLDNAMGSSRKFGRSRNRSPRIEKRQCLASSIWIKTNGLISRRLNRKHAGPLQQMLDWMRQSVRRGLAIFPRNQNDEPLAAATVLSRSTVRTPQIGIALRAKPVRARAGFGQDSGCRVGLNESFHHYIMRKSSSAYYASVAFIDF
jgi:hypothetical protein